MCGIVGYTGSKDATDILVDGLARLEYRGYDSAGIAIENPNGISLLRRTGKIANLRQELKKHPLSGTTGIGHTRWATHGAPNETNAHPHRSGRVIVVHNGIIENYAALRDELVAEGREFSSETDTEIAAHLIDRAYAEQSDLHQAMRDALRHIEGSYALAVLVDDQPGTIVAACQQSPLVLGISDDKESMLASDIPALISQTRDFVFLRDGEVAVLRPESIKLYDGNGEEIEPDVKHINWDPVMAEKGGYKHFMLKEIHEQPRAISNTLAGRKTRGRPQPELDELYKQVDADKLDQLYLIACGTSWHAAHIGKFLIEHYARIPVIVDYASEFRYRDPVFQKRSLGLAISQSGETADTISAARLCLDAEVPVLSICNVLESRLARLSNAVFYTHAGPEIGVASTKAFVTQISALLLIALDLGVRRKTMTQKEARLVQQQFSRLPRLLEDVLKQETAIKKIARAVYQFEDFLYLGRGMQYPLALEGALKLKEISYIHAEGYPAGEMKHGPIALIDEHLPTVCLMLAGNNLDKMLSNVEEVRARSGIVIGIVSEGEDAARALCDHVIEVPALSPDLDLILASVPLQLLAYHIAIRRGTDVDQPRNLAKSVTVE